MADFFSYELFPIICNMSLTASVIIVFVLLVRLLLKGAPKVFSYALWAVVLFRLLCPVSVTTGFSLLGLLDTPVKETTPMTSAVEYVRPDIVHAESPQVHLPVPGVSEAVNQAFPQGQEQQAADPLEAPVSIITSVWLTGVLVMVLYSAVSLLKLRRRLIGAMPLRDNVYLADHIGTPFVLGILRPKIYLPSSLSEQERAYIILHEQHHIRRHDPAVKLLSFAALCLHWFNPLVWAAFILSGKDMEMSCDEAVIKRLGEGVRADYSASLLGLATGRRIIAGMPLAFGEGSTAGRIKNVLRWRRPKVWIVLPAAAACVAVIAACGANPAGASGEDAVMTGQYASMEDFAQRTMDGAKTAHYYSAGGEGTANVTGTKLAWLEKQGECSGLAPEGTLEAWKFSYLVQVDASPDEIMLAGGMYEEDGWYDLEGQGGRNIVALRYEDGSYDTLYNAPVNDDMSFYGYHNSYEEAIYDWYVTENGLDLPLYAEDWAGRIAGLEDDSGNFPVHRYDGDGWYVYIPISGWERQAVTGDNADNTWCWDSAYDTGAVLFVTYFDPAVAARYSPAAAMQPLDGEQRVWEQQEADYIREYLTDAPDGGLWRVSVWVTADGVRDPEELEILYAMAESFTLDARMTAAAGDSLSRSLSGVQEGDPLTLRLEQNGGTAVYDSCWSVSNAVYYFRGLQSVSWIAAEGFDASSVQNSAAVTLAADGWSLTACEGANAVRFTGPAGEQWLTLADGEGSPYAVLREWFDELEFAALGGTYDLQSIVIPDSGQGYLEAAAAYVQAFESIHLQATEGSKFCYTFVSTSVEDAGETTTGMRERGEIGESTYCFYLTTVFVPQNEAAWAWSIAGNTTDYTGGDPGVPEGAMEYYRCGFITLEDDGWHGQLVGTGW